MTSWTLATELPNPPPPLSPAGNTFGRSLSFNGTFPLATDGSWLTAEGVPAVVEAVLLRWSSATGSFAFRPDFGGGAEEAVNQATSTANLDALRNKLRSQALEDPRVTGARIDLQPQPDGTLRVSGVLVVGGNNPFGFDTVFGAAI